MSRRRRNWPLTWTGVVVLLVAFTGAAGLFVIYVAMSVQPPS